MVCDLCGEEGAFIRRVDRNYGKAKDREIIEHIPIVYCPNCQQTYFTSETLQGISEEERDK